MTLFPGIDTQGGGVVGGRQGAPPHFLRNIISGKILIVYILFNFSFLTQQSAFIWTFLLSMLKTECRLYSVTMLIFSSFSLPAKLREVSIPTNFWMFLPYIVSIRLSLQILKYPKIFLVVIEK